jgi:hypothetical protein
MSNNKQFVSNLYKMLKEFLTERVILFMEEIGVTSENHEEYTYADSYMKTGNKFDYTPTLVREIHHNKKLIARAMGKVSRNGQLYVLRVEIGKVPLDRLREHEQLVSAEDIRNGLRPGNSTGQIISADSQDRDSNTEV